MLIILCEIRHFWHFELLIVGEGVVTPSILPLALSLQTFPTHPRSVGTQGHKRGGEGEGEGREKRVFLSLYVSTVRD